MAPRENGAGTRGGEAPVDRRGRRDHAREGGVRGRAEGTAKMADVTAHEDKCGGGCTGEGADVAHGVL